MLENDVLNELLATPDAADVIAAVFWRSGTLLDIDSIAELEPKKRPLFLAATMLSIAQYDPQVAEGLRIGKIVPALKEEALVRA